MDKATIQAQLAQLTNDWNELQAGLARLNEQIAQKNAEAERQKGALAYNQILAGKVKAQLDGLNATPLATEPVATKQA